MTTALVATPTYAAMPVLTAGSSIEAYISAIARIPLLEVEQEQAFANRLHKGQDLEAARQLVMSNLRFVVHIARGYMGYGLPLSDLIQEGNVGLMKAVKRFDPDKGVRLISFAVHWIKAEIHEYILKNWRIVKIATTKAQRKLFFNLRSAKQGLGWMNAAEIQSIAKELNVKPEEVMQMEARLGGQDMSFSLSDKDDNENSFSPEQYLRDDGDAIADIEEREYQEAREDQMRHALEQLDARSQDILRRRWLIEGEKAGLQQLADEYGVSAERIRQIESAAMKKIRKALS
jgi:RNA polymerase sigma-32 factor